MGCGPGTITADLALLVAPGETVGIDASADVVAQAQEHAAGVGLENLRFEVGDLFALGYPDASFDVIHLHQVLQHLDDPAAALVELRRVLAPDGVLAARDSDYGAFTWAPADPMLDRWLELYFAVTSATVTTPASAPPAGTGPRRRVRRRHRLELDVDLRRPRVAGLVGRTVGRPRPLLTLRRAGGRVRLERRRGARGDRRGVHALGRLARRGVRRHPCGDPGPRLTLAPSQSSESTCPDGGAGVGRFGPVSDIRPVAADVVPGPGQGLVLRTGFFRLDWTLRFTHTTVTIDDRTYELPWGAHYFPLEPGSHRLEVSYPYLRLSRAGRASIAVDVSPNQVVQASYGSPNSVLVAFRPGKLTVEPPVQL